MQEHPPLGVQLPWYPHLNIVLQSISLKYYYRGRIEYRAKWGTKGVKEGKEGESDLENGGLIIPTSLYKLTDNTN